jgi:hypothetical protein
MMTYLKLEDYFVSSVLQFLAFLIIFIVQPLLYLCVVV